MPTETHPAEAAVRLAKFIHTEAGKPYGRANSRDIPAHLLGPKGEDGRYRWLAYLIDRKLVLPELVEDGTWQGSAPGGRSWPKRKPMLSLTTAGLKLIDADVDATIHTDSDVVDVNTPRITAPEIFKKIGKNPKTIHRAFEKAGIAPIIKGGKGKEHVYAWDDGRKVVRDKWGLDIGRWIRPKN